MLISFRPATASSVRRFAREESWLTVTAVTRNANSATQFSGSAIVNVPIGGFIKVAQAQGHELIPVIWAGASASAHVTVDAFERIAGEITDAVKAGGFDAIYLDLHGAMVAEHADDGEGELLEVAMGPHHPSTHGVFRMDVALDGERVIKLKPVFGYLHRNHEKLGENTTYLGSMP